MDEFTLTKLSIEDGKYSKVNSGYSQSGYLSIAQNGKVSVQDAQISDVTEGSQVVITRGLTSWLNTSPIKEILEVTPTSVRFRTQTSVYLLEKRNENT